MVELIQKKRDNYVSKIVTTKSWGWVRRFVPGFATSASMFLHSGYSLVRFPSRVRHKHGPRDSLFCFFTKLLCAERVKRKVVWLSEQLWIRRKLESRRKNFVSQENLSQIENKNYTLYTRCNQLRWFSWIRKEVQWRVCSEFFCLSEWPLAGRVICDVGTLVTGLSRERRRFQGLDFYWFDLI